MLTKIIKIKGDWQEVVNDCRATVGKDELGKDPSERFKKSILISEHSPIRDISVKWKWPNIKSWVATHWVRHKWECFVETQRTDRTGVNRDELPQSAWVTFTGEANAQHLIDTWRKRLCGQASEETRCYAEDFKVALHDVEPEISDVLVPNCVYRCGCPELAPCRKWGDYCAWVDREFGFSPGVLSIKTRYYLYNKWFYATRSDSECRNETQQ